MAYFARERQAEMIELVVKFGDALGKDTVDLALR
jgi:hypothetical protein